MRKLLFLNIFLGMIAWGIFAVVWLGMGVFSDFGYLVYSALASAGALVSYRLWQGEEFRDDSRWFTVSTRKKLLGFAISPWGMFLMATLGIFIVGGLFLLYVISSRP